MNKSDVHSPNWLEGQSSVTFVSYLTPSSYFSDCVFFDEPVIVHVECEASSALLASVPFRYADLKDGTVQWASCLLDFC